MNQSGNLVKKAGMLDYAQKIIAGAVKPGDLSAVPLEPVPLEKGEPLALELAHFVESVRRARQPKVSGELAKSALELAIVITEQIRTGTRRP
jgi:predicted dehydrogenase